MATATDLLLNLNSAKKRAGRLIESGARRVRTRSFWLEKLPFLGFLAGGYNLDKLAGDCIAGLTTALTVIPQGIGYAPLAGLPLQVRRRALLSLVIVGIIEQKISEEARDSLSLPGRISHLEYVGLVEDTELLFVAVT